MSEKNRAIVIGGGHNGLVCAAYLAKAGIPVLVLEQKKIVGGCVVTEEVSPGWRINTYSFEHYAIRNTPIISDLSLERFGLDYYSVDPAVFCPFPDRRYVLLHRELSHTLKHLEGLSRKDAKAYESFHAKWAKVGAALGHGFLGGPASLESLLGRSGLFSKDSLNEILQECKLPISNILSENFETPYLSALIAFLGPAAVGLSPAAPNTGWLCAWHTGAARLARPRGGSGRLTQALAAAARVHGATILENEKVSEIKIRDGQAVGVRTQSGKEFDAEIIVSNADPKQTLLGLAGNYLSTADFGSIRAIEVTPGFAFKADYLLSGLPNYPCKPLDFKGDANECHRAATFVAPSVESLSAAFSEFSNGLNPKTPGLMVALHSTTDPSLAPRGKHGLVLETRYTPYKLYGLSWTEADREKEATRLLDLYSHYCPGIEKLVEGYVAKSPQDMESDVMVPQGNFMHADMEYGQMFEQRPSPGLLTGYEVRIFSNLFLCGAGTFPGGGVSGVPGRNAAMQIIDKLKTTPP
ncbi:MAG TPA: NAD(P)/FAD-dependent oxidoreductase [Nitrososphaerales archaeon]|nr:NAD(P)/FAD-dependent oxidoreductase [Nitrososphaerales archaeon]